MKINIPSFYIYLYVSVFFSCFAGAENGESNISQDPLVLLDNQVFFLKDSLRQLASADSEKKKGKLLVRMEILARGIQESTKEIELLAEKNLVSHNSTENETMKQFLQDFSARSIQKEVTSILDSSGLSLEDRCAKLVDLVSSVLPDERKIATYRQGLKSKPTTSDQPWPGSVEYDKMLQDSKQDPIKKPSK